MIVVGLANQSLQGRPAGWRPGSWLLQLKTEGSLGTQLPGSQGTSLSFLLRPSQRPTCVMEGNLLSSKSPDLNVNLTKKITAQTHLN